MMRPAFSLDNGTRLTPIVSKSGFLLAAIPVIFAVIWGCEDTNVSTVESTNPAPSNSPPGLSPDTVNVDTVAAVNGLYTIQATGMVQASDPDGNLSSVV